MRGGILPTAQNLLSLLGNRPIPKVWTVTGVGRNQLPLTAIAANINGHIRVGFEDSIDCRRGELANSNAQLVARERRVAQELGREVATPDEARRILDISR